MTIIKSRKKLINIVLIVVLSLSIFFTFVPMRRFLFMIQSRDYSLQSDQVTILKSSELPHYEEPTLENLAKVASMQKDISGKIVIPSVGINLPVTQGVEDYKMLYAAGEQYSRDIVSAGKNGNYVLASHSTPWENTLFTNLLNVQEGEKIYVSTSTHVFEYTISSVKAVDPWDVADIQQTDADGKAFNKPVITLYTCTDADATQRYVVRGEFTKKILNSKVTGELRTAFEDWHTLTLQE